MNRDVLLAVIILCAALIVGTLIWRSDLRAPSKSDVLVDGKPREVHILTDLKYGKTYRFVYFDRGAILIPEPALLEKP